VKDTTKASSAVVIVGDLFCGTHASYLAIRSQTNAWHEI